MELTDIKLFFPEISLIAGSILILLFGIFFEKNKNFHNIIFYITIFSLAVSLYSLIYFVEVNTNSFNNLLENSLYTFFFKKTFQSCLPGAEPY